MLTVVTGPPCVGKTTYVQANKGRSDVVIDFDLIAQAFGSPVTHSHPDYLRWIAVAARSAAIDAALEQHHKGARVWIVEANPPLRRISYTNHGARFVNLTAGRNELHRRADVERTPRWHKLIDDWYLDNAHRDGSLSTTPSVNVRHRCWVNVHHPAGVYIYPPGYK